MPPGRRQDDFEDSDLAERCAIELPQPGSRWVPPTCYLGALETLSDGDSSSIKTFIRQHGVSIKAELPQRDCIETKYSFHELPLTKATLAGLRKYPHMTKIQFLSIPHILKGRDIIAEAATGGGKTLCFVISILEAMRREVWQREDGCFALILTPTRELALQIFEVISTFREHTAVSAMTVFGGKHMLEEQQRIRDMGIVIGTPGRVLSHLEETYQFTTENVKMVVLDEADKLIELGFMDTTERILASLPPKEVRQNLFFSATLRSASRLLARKFCNSDNCERITEQFEGVVDASPHVDEQLGQPDDKPRRLRHSYMLIRSIDDKVATLYALLCANFKKKIIVFCSTIKQVRFLYESFTELKTGAKILEIHGKQDQSKRMYVFDEFNRRRAAVTILTTDLLGRGIDFPDVDLVIQLDCPPDVDTYTHRAGRTARGTERTGESILFLLASESIFLNRLKEKGFVMEAARPLRFVKDVTPMLRGLCARSADIKQLAIKYFVSFIKSYSLLTDTEVFRIQSILMRRSAFVASLGLVNVPELPVDMHAILQRDDETSHRDLNDDKDLDGGVEKSAKIKNRSRLDRLKERIAIKAAAKSAAKTIELSQQKSALPDDSDTEVSKPSRRERRRQKLQEIRQMGAAELMKDDTKLQIASSGLKESLVESAEQTKPADDLSSGLENWRESEQVKKALRKQRLVIRADGTAKIKGAAKLIPKNHKYFTEEDDQPVDPGTFEGALRMLDAEDQTVVESREDRLKRIQRQLRETRETELAEKAAKRLKRSADRRSEASETTVVDEADLESRLAAEYNL